MRDRQSLFSHSDWSSVEQYQLQQLRKEVNAVDADRLLNTAADDLARFFEAKFHIEVPVLSRDDIVVDQREAQIDVRYDPMRWIEDKSRPFYIAGTEVQVEIPFTGQSQVFEIRPTSYTLSPPIAEVKDSMLEPDA
jgi:hypothetical protein